MSTEDQDFVLLGDADVTGYNEQGLLPLSSEDIAKIQDWLDPTDYAASSSEYGKHSSSHLAGTGSWILQTEEYQRWHESDRGALWIKAIAGAGKSVLAASLAKRLMREDNTPVLYFFFRHIISANQKPQSLVRDFMSQILSYSVYLQHNLHSLIENRHTLDSMSLDKMWKLLLSALESIPRVYCVIDALDEMDTDDCAFLETLVSLGQINPRSIKILMTSRPVPHVEQVLRHSSVVQILLQLKSINPDISRYVRHRIDEFSVAETLSTKIHDIMVQKADGHFLYARLMMDDLCVLLETSPTDTEKLMLTLDAMPRPMADMYTKMLQDHSRRSNVPQDLQVAILQWVTRAERPVRLLELSTMINMHRVNLDVAMDNKAVIRKGCGPLLEILEDETVCPIHHSFTEYLYDQDRCEAASPSGSFPVLNHKTVQSALAASCITQLRSDWYLSWPEASLDSVTWVLQPTLTKLKLEYPSLDYSLHHWHIHLRKADVKCHFFISELDKLLLKDTQMLFAILDASNQSLSRFHRTGINAMASWTALHAAAHLGLAFYVEHLIKQEFNVDCMDTEGHTPLALAASKGHAEIVEVLLRAGAAADTDDDHGYKPLHHAALGNHHQVLNLLLAAGVNPLTPKTKDPGRWCGNSPSSIGDTALKYACNSGHVESIQRFVPYLNKGDLRDALCWTLNAGQTKAVQALLQIQGIDVNPNETGGKSPIYMACKARDIASMRLLINMGADVCVPFDSDPIRRGYLSETADWFCCDSLLHAVVSGRQYHARSLKASIDLVTEGLALLLDAGVNPDTVGAHGSTVLHTILSNCKYFTDDESHSSIERLLSMLFARGLSPQSLRVDGGNAFHSAKGLWPGAVLLLQAHKVDINHIRPSDNLTPILCALTEKDTISASSFLAHGADTNLTDWSGNTPLHLATQISEHGFDYDLFETLIANGADINARNKDGNTPLHLNNSLNPKLIAKFIEHGFDLDSKNNRGRTVLFQSIHDHAISEEQCSVMAKAGADLLTRDERGWTILHCIFGRQLHEQKIELARYFVQKGVNPRAVDYTGNTLWHVLGGNSSLSDKQMISAAMDFLLEHEVPASVRNNLGQLPIHVACHQRSSLEPLTSVQLLCEHNMNSLDAMDNNKIRPLHTAASFNSEFTYWLLDRGTQLTAVTVEGQSALMVACRNRQPNIVGILLDRYHENDQLVHIDQTDQIGRSALHYACRSGIPETVALLLEAGIKVNVKDKRGLTPLATCAEYLEEQALWTDAPSSAKSNACYGMGNVSNILMHDKSRPVVRNMDQDPIRIRETLRLLMQHGADMSFLTQSPFDDGSRRRQLPYVNMSASDPLQMALTRGCDAMVSELLLIQAEMLPKEPSSENVKALWDKFMHKFKSAAQLLRLKYTPEAITQHLINDGADIQLVNVLLRADDEPGIQTVQRLAPDFFKLDLDFSNHDPIPQMICWGFADLLNILKQNDNNMIDFRTTIETALNDDQYRKALTKLLRLSLERSRPNMKILKFLIEHIGIDPDELIERKYSFEPSKISILHVLAKPTYWWQTKALEYLVERGANIEVLNSNRETPLLAALRATRHQYSDSLWLKAVAILLAHGADPNATDDQGITCLNASAGHPKCVQLLLSYGADPCRGSHPFIFDVIEMQHADILRTIVKSGVNLNITVQETEMSRGLSQQNDNSNGYEAQKPSPKWSNIDHQSGNISKWAYPIHFAASHLFNTPDKRPKAIEIINLLLEAGADPNLTYKEGNVSILHVLAQNGGILHPFLKDARCDLEARDDRGCTLLLAACSSDTQTCDKDSYKDTIGLLIDQGASLEARDDQGCNIVHYMVSRGQEYSDFKLIPNQLLLRLICQENNEGRTPFHYVLSHGSLGLVNICLEHGVDPTIPDPRDGSIALHHLATKLTDFDNMMSLLEDDTFVESFREQTIDPEEEIVRHLIDEEVRLENAGSSELLQRSARHHFKTILKRGVSINARDHKGETPLHWLVSTPVDQRDESWICVSQALMFLAELQIGSTKIDFGARNLSGESALHKLAAQTYYNHFGFQEEERHHVERNLKAAFKFLVDNGADVTWEDAQSRTCLDVAAACRADWLLEMFKRK